VLYLIWSLVRNTLSRCIVDPRYRGINLSIRKPLCRRTEELMELPHHYSCGLETNPEGRNVATVDIANILICNDIVKNIIHAFIFNATDNCYQIFISLQHLMNVKYVSTKLQAIVRKTHNL
jgi:hypothetical protein